MTATRFLKKCEDFMICSEIGESGDVFVDLAEENKTLYQIIIKGSGRGGKFFDTDFIEVNANTNNFIDRKKYLGTNMIFEAYEDYHIFGFNYRGSNINWDGKLITESFTGNDRSWLICFDGRPIINGVEIGRMDYAKLENKRYEVNINDGIVAVFTKNGI